MSSRSLLFGLLASLGVAWLFVIAMPIYDDYSQGPIALNEALDGAAGVYVPKREGRVTTGAEVYAQNGCYVCHTQLVRPTYAGNDMFRADWGGLKDAGDKGDTRRETNRFDYQGERFAQIGLAREGPDLSNVALRVETKLGGKDVPEWFFKHLYNPRADVRNRNSTCPSMKFLFEKRKIRTGASADAVAVDAEGNEYVPGDEARALVSYLMSLKKDEKVPAVLNFAPKEKPAN